MELPNLTALINSWPSQEVEKWEVLIDKIKATSTADGASFNKMSETIQNLANTNQLNQIIPLLNKRLAARVLTWLVLTNETVRKQFSSELLKTLERLQAPRFTRITLTQLVDVYFQFFDLLDEYDSELREELESIIKRQIKELPIRRIDGSYTHPLETLREHSSWLLSLNGPLELVKKVQEKKSELQAAFAQYGITNFDTGRYADTCRSLFYIETLKSIEVGSDHAVLSEILKPEVHTAPFEDSLTIGHEALKIIIDRAGSSPSEIWQNFVLELAGDPRIKSSHSRYRKWWLLLGDERTNIVRGWLSKLDISLFLEAVDEYGRLTNNDDLTRMFAARKVFLEGLSALELIRNSRLLLGEQAKNSIAKMLDTGAQVSFASLRGGDLSDKAIIYLDCGDFHIIEGSHNFKIWLYLALPSQTIISYDKDRFSHTELTTSMRNSYLSTYNLSSESNSYADITHNPHNQNWQANVFKFLADNGIEVDIENLLTPQDYKEYIQRHGLPVIASTRRQVASSFNTKKEELSYKKPIEELSSLSPESIEVLRYILKNPNKKALIIARELGLNRKEINQVIYKELLKYTIQNSSYEWNIKEGLKEKLTSILN